MNDRSPALPSSTLLATALRGVVEACAVARSVQRDLQRVRQITKDDKSPVTVADFAVQAVVALRLRETAGQSLIVGEEDAHALRRPEQAAVLRQVLHEVQAIQPGATEAQVLDAIDACDHDAQGDAYWTLDPIDGTKGFLRGEQYAIALARLEHGEVVLGVMGCPNLPIERDTPLDGAGPGCVYAATRGGGAWELPIPPGPIDGPRIAGAMADAQPVGASRWRSGDAIRACESVESAHSNQDQAAQVLRSLGEPGAPVRLDSQCKYAVVARGQADVYLRLPTRKQYVEAIWDHAAGMIIAQEAGAVVTDISGAALDFTRGRRLHANRGIVCAAPGLHPHLIRAIDRLGRSAATA